MRIIDPQLGVFIPELGYYALISGSPAINSGNLATCTATDQRGVTRPVGAGCDVGAYEYTVPGAVASLTILDGNNQRTPPTFSFPKVLKVMALDNQGSPVPNVNIAFTAPDAGPSATFMSTGTNIMSVLTNTGGVAATSTLVANNQPGVYSISASVNNVMPVNFNVENGAWYVSAHGNDTNDCLTSATPCATINGAINKPALMTGDLIFVAEGTYHGTGSQVVKLNKNVSLSGGWDQSFLLQNGVTVIDGENLRRGVVVEPNVTASIDHFMVMKGYAHEGMDGTGGGI